MLKVNSVFGPTIQGEGPSQGKEVYFIRLAFCNLSCQWCDTKYTWDWKNYDRSKEVHEMTSGAILEQLQQAKAVVISGGEPLLQQRNLLSLIESLKRRNVWVEIETNGTIGPEYSLVSLVDQFNCSPKLSNSGDSKECRVKSKALFILSSIEKVFFKFVIGTEKDIEEVIEYIQNYSISSNRVYLMPLGKTKKELERTTPIVEELCKKHSFIFSRRLHVELWGEKRDV